MSLSMTDRFHFFLDQLIGDLLEGTSGKLIWGVLQLLLTILGNVGEYNSSRG